ncbi:hypothetical protein ACQ1ZK_17795, partial [Enterococcus faecium]
KAGTVYSAGKDLLDRLASMRLLLVPVGEMESFDKSVDGHGSPWVSAMHEKGGHKSSAEARQLVGPLGARSAAT